MKRVLVLVEGQTEERFVKDVLRPHLWPLEIDMIPKVVTTKKVKRGPDFKGGITDYQKVANDLHRLLHDTGVVSVTTFLDYYGLPSDFPGIGSRPPGSAHDRARHVETEWRHRINDFRFHPYLMIHEFEALLFAKPEELCRVLNKSDMLPELEKIRNRFPTPEDINDNPKTAPSKRIAGLFPEYQKTLHGPLITQEIGLKTIRRECRHFHEWLTWLERL